jgi:hypothetical protein
VSLGGPLSRPPSLEANSHPVWAETIAPPSPGRQQKCVGRQSRTGTQRRYWSEEREQGSCHAQLRSRSSSRQAAGITGPWVVIRRRLGCYLVWASHAAVVSKCRAHGMLGQWTSSTSAYQRSGPQWASRSKLRNGCGGCFRRRIAEVQLVPKRKRSYLKRSRPTGRQAPSPDTPAALPEA